MTILFAHQNVEPIVNNVYARKEAEIQAAAFHKDALYK
jgi:hypothetical protein